MAVTKNTYSPGTTIIPFMVKTMKDSSDNIIIIDVEPNYTTQTQATINRDVTVIAVTSDYHVTVVNSLPDNASQIGQHSNFSKSLIKIKGGEVFVTEHSSTTQTDNNQTAVTGYSLGTFDTVYAQIDRVADTVRIYA